MRIFRYAILGFVAWLAVSTSAGAHPILIHAGTLQWNGATLDASLSLESHCFEHEKLPLGQKFSTEEIARALIRAIHVTTPHAEELKPSNIRIDSDGKVITWQYDVPSDASVLVMTHISEGVLAPLSRQIQFTQAYPDGGNHLVRLTSAGNPEILRRDRPAEQPLASFEPLCEPLICVCEKDDPTGLILQIDYPCSILKTWPDLVPPGDSMTPADFHKRKALLKKWAMRNLRIDKGDAASVDSVILLGADDQPVEGKDKQRLSPDTTRIRWCIGIPGQSAESGEPITWKGFNLAVFSIPVMQTNGDRTRPVGLMTSTQNTLVFAQTITTQPAKDSWPLSISIRSDSREPG